MVCATCSLHAMQCSGGNLYSASLRSRVVTRALSEEKRGHLWPSIQHAVQWWQSIFSRGGGCIIKWIFHVLPKFRFWGMALFCRWELRMVCLIEWRSTKKGRRRRKIQCFEQRLVESLNALPSCLQKFLQFPRFFTPGYSFWRRTRIHRDPGSKIFFRRAVHV